MPGRMTRLSPAFYKMKHKIRHLKYLCFLAISLGGFFVWPNIGLVATNNIIFSEIMYDPAGSDTDHEWVELYNAGVEVITIIDGSGTDSWRFNDGSNHTLTFVQGSLNIPPGGTAVLTSDAATFLSDHPNFMGTVLDTVMSLNNTTDTLKLSSDKGENFFGEITYQNTWGGNGDGKSLEKINLTDNNNQANWRSSSIDNGTPGSIITTPETAPTSSATPNTSTPEPTVVQKIETIDPKKIKISELYPNPNNASELEFIELWNSGTQTIPLEGWKLGDSVKIITLGKISLVPGEYRAFYSNETKISLNNTKETITLYDINGQLIDKIEYNSTIKGQSYVYDITKQAFTWSTKTTPNSYNEIIKPNDPPQAHISFSYNPAAINEEIIISAEESTDPDDDPLKFSWQIGDKWQASGARFNYSFNSLGTHIINLTITDGRHTVFATSSITILPPEEILSQRSAAKILSDNSSKASSTISIKKSALSIKNTVKTIASSTNDTFYYNNEIVDVDLVGIHDLEINTLARVQGPVVVEPGVLAKTYFYIANPAGIQVYFSKSDWPKINLGDVVGVIGTVVENNGESRLRISNKQDLSVLYKSNPPLPLEIETGSIDENVEGYLIKITGELSQKQGSNWLIDDGSGAAKIVFQTAAKIKKPTVKVGEWLEIVGLVSETKTGYRILPRYNNDIRLLKPEETVDKNGEVLGTTTTNNTIQRFRISSNNQSQNIIKYLLITALGLIVLLIGLIIKMKIEIKKRSLNTK